VLPPELGLPPLVELPPLDAPPLAAPALPLPALPLPALPSLPSMMSFSLDEHPRDAEQRPKHTENVR
jgi:hypothetical protein